MIQSILRRIKTGETTSDSADDHRAGLFQCPDCHETFISMHLEVCPTCRSPVEAIKTERELGYE
ncbi:MAG: hypothetical protein ABEH64_02675 [Salinirussus sp.]